MTGITFAFFQSLEKTSSIRQILNNKESGFMTEDPQSFSILIDIPSCPWALLEFKPCINFSIFFESISPVLSLSEVSKLWIEGRVLLFGIGWHCLLKKSLKLLALSLKLVTSLLLFSIGGISGTFLPLIRVLIIDQYAFAEILGSLSLLASRS